MVLHKKSVIRLILLTLLLITLFSSFQIQNVQAKSSITYSFDESVLYDVSNPLPNSDFNVRNQTEFLWGNYSATYTFNGEIAQTDISISFIDSETSHDGGSEIIASLDDHDTVLQFQDDITGGQDPSTKHDIVQRTSGIIEFWLRTNDNTNYPVITLLEGATTVERLRLTAGNIAYTSSAPAWVEVAPFVNNEWYHIRMDWGADNKWDLYINGSLLVDDVAVENNQVGGVDGFSISHSGDTANYIYIDAFGVSWDSNYNINDNVIPYNFLNQTLEVDKYEFYNNADGSITNPTQENIPFWSELIASGFIVKNAPVPSYQFEDETAVRFSLINANHEGLERTFDVVTSRIIQINFTLWFYYARMGSEKWYNVFEVDSFDDTLICRLRIDDDAVLEDLRLSYYDGASYVEIEDLPEGIEGEGLLHLNITIHNNIVKCETNEGSYIFPTIEIDKEGLGDVKFETYLAGVSNEGVIWIDSIGVYVDGVSLTNDYASYYYDINGNYEHSEHNLMRINATGYFSAYIRGAIIGEGSHTFFTYQNVSSISLINSNKDHQVVRIMDAWFAVSTNQSFTINSIIITGVILRHGSNSYFPSITDSNINDTESYFYVDSNNRLRYNLIVNDNNSEFIQASFNIPNFLSENYSASFLSNIDGNSYGFFRVSYIDDTSTFLPFPIWMSTTTVILPQTREIESFAILITDNDEFYNDRCYGFVSNVQFIYTSGMNIKIITLNLMMVIVPLMVLLVPTFGISARFGKNTILPVFILMSIICFATSLIPIWVFFVIMLSAGAFLFMKRKGSDD